MCNFLSNSNVSLHIHILTTNLNKIKMFKNKNNLQFSFCSFIPFSCSCTRNIRLCSLGLVMCGGIYGYCGGSKFGRHQLPIVSSTIQSCLTPSCLPKVCKPHLMLSSSFLVLRVFFVCHSI